MRSPRWLIGEVGVSLWLIVRAARGYAADLIERDDLAARRSAEAFRTYVWRPLPMLVVLATLTGLAAGAGARGVLLLYHAELAIEPALVRILARSLVPVVIGVFAAGRIAVDLTVRLGAMRARRELEALETLGHDPARYVLAPALVAVVAAAPIHILAGFAGAWLAAGLVLDLAGVTRLAQFAALTLGDATARALLAGVVRTLVYALLAFAVGAAIGSRDERGAARLGDQATLSFTAGLLAVFAAAALWETLA